MKLFQNISKRKIILDFKEKYLNMSNSLSDRNTVFLTAFHQARPCFILS